MSFDRRHLLLVPLVLVAAWGLTRAGAPIAGDAAPKSPGGAGSGRPVASPRSPDDGGFSIVLTSPLDRYLVGVRRVAVETIVPEGDAVARVDFLVDGRLVHTALEPPFACETDFGDEILRHTISVRATTRDGRRARVSHISRSSDLSNGAAQPLEIVPVLVRDRRGRPVSGLTVSDFVLMENGRRQRIVHFDDEPAPASIAVVVAGPPDDAAAREEILRGAGRLSELLPQQHALRLVDAWDPGLAKSGAASDGVNGFSYLRHRFHDSLARAAESAPPGSPKDLEAILVEAAADLERRPGGRVLLLLGPGIEEADGPPPAGTAPSAGTSDDDTPGGAPEDGEALPDGRERADPPAPSPLAGALDAFKRARVTFYAIVPGRPGSGDGLAAALERAADETGGEVLRAADASQFAELSEKVSVDLRSRYLLCYLPEHPDRKGWRSLDLSVGRSGLEVRARRVHARGLEQPPERAGDRDPSPGAPSE